MSYAALVKMVILVTVCYCCRMVLHVCYCMYGDDTIGQLRRCGRDTNVCGDVAMYSRVETVFRLKIVDLFCQNSTV